MSTGRTFINIKERQTELMLTLEPTQTILSAARTWKNYLFKKRPPDCRAHGTQTPPFFFFERVRAADTMMVDFVEVRAWPTGGRIGANQVSKFDREGRGDDEGLTKEGRCSPREGRRWWSGRRRRRSGERGWH